MKKKIRAMLDQALERCFESGQFSRTTVPEYVIEVPNSSNHGHFASNLPLLLASSQRRRPADLAKIILENLEDREQVFEKAEVAGPGFINFTVDRKEWHKLLRRIVTEGKNYGRSRLGTGQSILMEFENLLEMKS